MYLFKLVIFLRDFTYGIRANVLIFLGNLGSELLIFLSMNCVMCLVIVSK